MLIDDLIAEFLPNQDNELRQSIDHIIRIKKGGDEGIRMDRAPLLENYLRVQLEELETLIPENPAKPRIEEFDYVFRTIVKSGVCQ